MDDCANAAQYQSTGSLTKRSAAAIFSIKKGVVMAYVKKRAFLRLGALTDNAGVETAKKVAYQEYFTGTSMN
jgi:hypothetical protein